MNNGHCQYNGTTIDRDVELDPPANGTTSEDTSNEVSMLHEIKLLVNIGLPTSLFQLFVHFVLASFSLASLTGNLFCLSISIGGLSASDTLMSRAFGL